MVTALILTPSAEYPCRNFTKYSAYEAKYSFRMDPPSMEPPDFIHPGGLHGEEKRYKSGFTPRAARSVGKIYPRSCSMLNFFRSGSGSGLSSKLYALVE